MEELEKALAELIEYYRNYRLLHGDNGPSPAIERARRLLRRSQGNTPRESSYVQ